MQSEGTTPPTDVTFIDNLKSCNDDRAVECLSKLNAEWSQRYQFAEFDGDRKRSLVDALCHLMENRSSSDRCRRHCVEMIRLLSRDKSDIDRWIDDRLINNLIIFAGFSENKQSLAAEPTSELGRELSLEAQKALSNLMFQSEKARRLCIGSECLDGLGRRLREDLYESIQGYERRFYDLRLMFLMTALCPDVRAKCRDPPLDGLNSLTNIFESLIRGENRSMDGDGAKSGRKEPMSEKDINLVCETLKVAFNLVLPFKMTEVTENEIERLNRLADITRDGLRVQITDEAKKEELQSNIVNLLAALPSQCYLRLTPKIESTAESTAAGIPVYDGQNMEAIQILLDFLATRLGKPPREQLELLSPILTLLIDMARKHRHLRKFMRFIVLPPLTDVMRRPEEGDTLRNRLVRLMTSVTTEIKDLAADFLFELCNRSIDRLIKYTGFGNAAGMLSLHGLMGAAVSGAGKTTDKEEDENSDTEEYIRVRNQINPILGCYEAPRPDPMAGMSEEQKEYEAMKLVEQIDKLMKQGVVVPGRLGDDGRVHPVEHVLQLAEEAGRSGMIRRPGSDSDEDVDD